MWILIGDAFGKSWNTANLAVLLFNIQREQIYLKNTQKLLFRVVPNNSDFFYWEDYEWIMGTEEIPHIDSVNDTLKMILGEIQSLNQTMGNISNILDKIANDTYRIP